MRELRPGPDEAIVRLAARLGIGDPTTLDARPLSGGVSSDVWVVHGPGGSACIKRALPTLRVAARWEAPIERNLYELRWFETASAIVPGSVPNVLAHDTERHLFAMEYLPPDMYRNWKTMLLAGDIDPAVAAALGDLLGRVHAMTANDDAVAKRFASDTLFFALRLDPYFESLVHDHPDLAQALRKLIRTTAETRVALVHGDVSPKNLLIGPDGPVLIDAECAWYGDPAFDVAFCCTHLLLKTLVVRRHRVELARAVERLLAAHARHVHWEARAALDTRTAHLVAGLLLARVDGKSPVEYLDEDARSHVRRFARRHVLAPTATTDELVTRWHAETPAHVDPS
jgi:5-methylthioribose kinase